MIAEIEASYLVSGFVLPLFYIPQMAKLWHDNTRLESYSLSKATAQLSLRFPALLFGMFVANSVVMTIAVAADMLGRCLEMVCAFTALRRQGECWSEIAARINPMHALREVCGARQAQVIGQSPVAVHIPVEMEPYDR